MNSRSDHDGSQHLTPVAHRGLAWGNTVPIIVALMFEVVCSNDGKMLYAEFRPSKRELI